MIADEEHQTLYAERIRAYFAFSGARLGREEPTGGRWVYILPNMAPTGTTYMGEPCSTQRYFTEDAAMRSALYAMGLNIECERWHHETKAFEIAGEQRL